MGENLCTTLVYLCDFSSFPIHLLHLITTLRRYRDLIENERDIQHQCYKYDNYIPKISSYINTWERAYIGFACCPILLSLSIKYV